MGVLVLLVVSKSKHHVPLFFLEVAHFVLEVIVGVILQRQRIIVAYMRLVFRMGLVVFEENIAPQHK